MKDQVFFTYEDPENPWTETPDRVDLEVSDFEGELALCVIGDDGIGASTALPAKSAEDLHRAIGRWLEWKRSEVS